MTSSLLEVDADDKSWSDFKAKKTKAFPKNSLFGSQLEIYDETDKKNVQTLDLADYEKSLKRSSRKALPASVQQRLPGEINWKCFFESLIMFTLMRLSSFICFYLLSPISLTLTSLFLLKKKETTIIIYYFRNRIHCHLILLI